MYLNLISKTCSAGARTLKERRGFKKWPIISPVKNECKEKGRDQKW